MSGGGNKPIKGRMGCRVVDEVDPKAVEKLQQDLTVDVERCEVREKLKRT